MRTAACRPGRRIADHRRRCRGRLLEIRARRRADRDRSLRHLGRLHPDAHDARTNADRASFERLMVEGGLRQISVHVDMTQAGRHGFPIGRIKCEADLHPVRQAFTDLALRVREKTGAASGVCPQFYRHPPQHRRCARSDPLVSGRSDAELHLAHAQFPTRSRHRPHDFSQRPITSADVWEKICEGVGLPLRRDVSIFGHPDCNSWASLLIARPSGKIFPLLPDDKKFDSLLGEVLRKSAASRS